VGEPATEPPLEPPGPEAPAPVPVSTDGRHTGFFFRAELGGGYVGATATLPGESGPMPVSIGGGAVSFSAAVGGALVENLVLAAEAWMISASNPLRSAAGESYRVDDSSLDVFGLGVQVTWYLPSWNAYLSVTPSFSTLSVQEGFTTVSTRDGFGLKVGAGKEWWIGGHWGLGLAGQFFYSGNEDAGAPGVTWTSLGGALAFTATYN
jgi:hypothetical protein